MISYRWGIGEYDGSKRHATRIEKNWACDCIRDRLGFLDRLGCRCDFIFERGRRQERPESRIRHYGVLCHTWDDLDIGDLLLYSIH